MDKTEMDTCCCAAKHTATKGGVVTVIGFARNLRNMGVVNLISDMDAWFRDVSDTGPYFKTREILRNLPVIRDCGNDVFMLKNSKE